MTIDAPSRPAAPQVRSRHSPVALASAALLTAGAGAIHLAVVPEHLAEYLPFGVFFLLVGFAQLVAAIAVVRRPGRRLCGVLAAATLLLVLLWLCSRTSGLPIGPEPWVPEEIGAPDVICNGLELLSLPVLIALRVRGSRPRRRRPVRTPLLVAGIAVLTVVATVGGVGTGLSGMSDAFSVAPPAPGTTSVTALVAASGPKPLKEFTLTARTAVINGKVADTYDGTVPGPELRVTQGDRVRVTKVKRIF